MRHDRQLELPGLAAGAAAGARVLIVPPEDILDPEDEGEADWLAYRQHRREVELVRAEAIARAIARRRHESEPDAIYDPRLCTDRTVEQARRLRARALAAQRREKGERTDA